MPETNPALTSVLRYLAEHRVNTFFEIADALNLSTAVVSKTMNIAANEHLVESFKLTPAGRAYLQQHEKEQNSWSKFGMSYTVSGGKK